MFMVNYENSVIYKLCCTDPTVEEVYVGSTTNFRKRKNQHKECCTNASSKKHGFAVYNYIRENGGWDNWDMVQVAEVNAKDKRALHATERRYVEQLGATLNRQVPTKTRKQYYDDNRDKSVAHVKQYYQDHKAERRAYLDAVIECECGLTSTRSHMSRHKRTQRHNDSTHTNFPRTPTHLVVRRLRHTIPRIL